MRLTGRTMGVSFLPNVRHNATVQVRKSDQSADCPATRRFMVALPPFAPALRRFRFRRAVGVWSGAVRGGGGGGVGRLLSSFGTIKV